MAFTSDWNVTANEGDKAFAYEQEQADHEGEIAPLYRLMLSYQWDFVRARWERLDGTGLAARWTLVCSGRGELEVEAVKALRENLRVLRKVRAEHRPMGAWSISSEVDYAVVL